MGVIVLVDVCISVPLITLSFLDDDLIPVVNLEKCPRLNVSASFGARMHEPDYIINIIFSLQRNGILENYYVIQCGTNVDVIFVMLTIFYKLVLHAVALVMAFLTRNIKVDVLNDYRYNTAIIIASSLLLITVIIITHLMDGYKTRTELVWAIMTFLTISAYLGLTFVPKVSFIEKYICY